MSTYQRQGVAHYGLKCVRGCMHEDSFVLHFTPLIRAKRCYTYKLEFQAQRKIEDCLAISTPGSVTPDK
ncbi:MAG: hypothetical protein EZS28_047884 [Streblomastix strix]|uniref:Uncharacterized protein n=1 Tax=Streblomastix strix TaxID=222440 RepID=A0A5J4TFZ2_9EUKA|nr:MAG: hypothetical protein EZS28_047884 [Streblomastix strix]